MMHLELLLTIYSLLAATTSLVQAIPQVSTQTSTNTIQVATTTITTLTTTVAAAASTSLSSSFTNALDFRISILNSTNFFRWEHSAAFLYWNSSLASYAQNYVDGCVWAHSGGKSGENLALGYQNVTAAVDAWGFERSAYHFGNSPTGFSEDTGHFTQLVWKSTTSVGCAWADCTGKNDLQGVYLVCEYWPAGNIVGNGNQWFVSNVASQTNDGNGYDFNAAVKGVNGSSGTETVTPTGATQTAAAVRMGGERGGINLGLLEMVFGFVAWILF